jgi:hypothetical protein
VGPGYTEHGRQQRSNAYAELREAAQRNRNVVQLLGHRLLWVKMDIDCREQNEEIAGKLRNEDALGDVVS